MNRVEALRRDYRVALLRYLPRREESALAQGYDIGRAAVADGVSVLHLAHVHHAVLLEVLVSAPHEDLPQVAEAASEFLLEALAPFDLARRQPPDALTPGA